MRPLLFALLPLLVTAGTRAATEIAFGPVRAQPGESVRLVSSSESKNGKVEITKDGRTTNGTIRILRERDISWTFRAPEADGTRRGMVSVAKIATTSSVMVGSEAKVQLELTGQVMVDLKTLLDERLALKGIIITSTGKLSDSKKVTLPVSLVVTKSFVKGF